MQKLLLSLIICIAAFAQTTITGTFKNPDGTTVTGRAVILITRPTIPNFCGSPFQTLTFRPVTIRITSGTLGALSLLSGPCMVAQKTPSVSPGPGAGMGATATLTSGTDLQATISVTTGTMVTASMPIATITFAGAPYTPAAACIFTSTTAGTNPSYVSNASRIQLSATVMASTTYSFSYYCQLTPYIARIYEGTTLLYTGNWIVPNQMTADVTVLDRL